MTALNAGCDMVLLCNQSVETEGGAAVDELLAGLEKARLQAKWRPSEVSELRRLDLLPQRPVVSWDGLMAGPRYLRALDLVSARLG